MARVGGVSGFSPGGFKRGATSLKKAVTGAGWGVLPRPRNEGGLISFSFSEQHQA